MANDGTYIYIGNTFPPRVYVLDPATATLERSIVLPPGAIEGLAAVPTGLALTAEGNIVVADGQNHRLIIVRPDGTLVRVVDRPSGSWISSPGNNIGPKLLWRAAPSRRRVGRAASALPATAPSWPWTSSVQA
jgi:DNA-binding beta-propeller fold protein YncE